MIIDLDYIKLILWNSLMAITKNSKKIMIRKLKCDTINYNIRKINSMFSPSKNI